MKNIFLGKPIHWILLALVATGMWFIGTQRMHVIHFNSFVLIVIAVSAVCVLFVLFGYRQGEQLTRDEIVPDETEKNFEDRDG